MNEYDSIRHLADTFGLVGLVIVFLVLAVWVFRPGSRRHYDEAANMIFADKSEDAERNRE